MSGMSMMIDFLFFLVGLCTVILFAMFTASWISRGSRLAYIGVIAFCFACLGGYFVMPKPPVYEYHNVKVVRVVDTYTWILKKDDGEFVAPFCKDYDLSAYNPAPGLVMNKLKYRDLGVCWTVKSSELGFWWKRDSNGIAVKEN